MNVSFLPTFDGMPVVLNEGYYSIGKDSIQFETCKFYISSLELMEKGRVVWKEENSFHLIDASNASSLKMNFNIPADIQYDHIKFNLGIDSITNTSGAMGGALDPTRGMYWTWQSGYINLKLEGKSNLCKTIHNEFSFHLGGYTSPYCSMQTINLAADNLADIVIEMDLKTFFTSIDLAQQNQLMSPGSETLLLSKIISKTFRIQ